MDDTDHDTAGPAQPAGEPSGMEKLAAAEQHVAENTGDHGEPPHEDGSRDETDEARHRTGTMTEEPRDDASVHAAPADAPRVAPIGPHVDRLDGQTSGQTDGQKAGPDIHPAEHLAPIADGSVLEHEAAMPADAAVVRHPEIPVPADADPAVYPKVAVPPQNLAAAAEPPNADMVVHAPLDATAPENLHVAAQIRQDSLGQPHDPGINPPAPAAPGGSLLAPVPMVPTNHATNLVAHAGAGSTDIVIPQEMIASIHRGDAVIGHGIPPETTVVAYEPHGLVRLSKAIEQHLFALAHISFHRNLD